jgi:hypothetical protein
MATSLQDHAPLSSMSQEDVRNSLEDQIEDEVSCSILGRKRSD